VLRERVEDFVANRGDPAELDTLLKECVADGSLEGLACARRLYESDYGGVTFSWELKAPAASTLVMWGEVGIQALLDGARHYPSHKNISLCAQLLASLAAGSALTTLWLRSRPRTGRENREIAVHAIGVGGLLPRSLSRPCPLDRLR
jgi:hypothetical protein